MADRMLTMARICLRPDSGSADDAFRESDLDENGKQTGRL